MSASNRLFNLYPEFIWGEATSEETDDGFDPFEYLTHTRYPRFMCRVAEDVSEATGSPFETKLKSVIGFMPGTSKELYTCETHGVFMSDFIWLDPRPEAGEIKKACDAAVLNRLLRDDRMHLNQEDL